MQLLLTQLSLAADRWRQATERSRVRRGITTSSPLFHFKTRLFQRRIYSKSEFIRAIFAIQLFIKSEILCRSYFSFVCFTRITLRAILFFCVLLKNRFNQCSILFDLTKLKLRSKRNARRFSFDVIKRFFSRLF